LAYDLRLGHMISRLKGIIEEIHFGAQSNPLAIIEVLDPEKTSFRPSKWPWKFRNRKTAKNSKLPEDCFEPVGIGGWPPISTWIIYIWFHKEHKSSFINDYHWHLLNSTIEHLFCCRNIISFCALQYFEDWALAPSPRALMCKTHIIGFFYIALMHNSNLFTIF
jgi:hypothetical protein